MACVYYSIGHYYNKNLARLSLSKLFLIVSSLILFLNHSIWSFLAQVMLISLRLAGLTLPRISGQKTVLAVLVSWFWLAFRMGYE